MRLPTRKLGPSDVVRKRSPEGVDQSINGGRAGGRDLACIGTGQFAGMPSDPVAKRGGSATREVGGDYCVNHTVDAFAYDPALLSSYTSSS